MWVCPGSCACTKHLLKVNQGCPIESDPGCSRRLVCCALETDRFPHAGVSKVGLSRMAVPVSHSLGGGAEHGSFLFFRNRMSGPNALSHQTPQGSGMMPDRSQPGVYACRGCSSVSRKRRCHTGLACLSRPARTAPVSPQAPRVRPIVVSHSPGVFLLF